MTHHDIFDSLTRNAFDFLERGISEFDKSPKYSVIHFCAAVEMLLKARLMKEHWSLIVSKPDQANLAKFMAGDFSSVTLEDARARIRDVAGEDIGDDACVAAIEAQVDAELEAAVAFAANSPEPDMEAFLNSIEEG